MKKLIKFGGMFLLLFVLIFLVYCGCVIHEARKYAREIVSLDLTKAQWRHPAGIVHKFEISINDLSKRQLSILLKVQDPGFYHHKGIDLSTPGAGLTTITQAITKKLYFENFKPGIAKIKQSIIARFVAHEMISKNDQLTIFLNSMYFGVVDGNPIVGFESAAKAYHHKTLNLLNESQYISLIAMIVAPDTFHLIDHPEWNAERSRRIQALIDGKYKPKGLMDQFYGELPKEVIEAGLPPVSYLGKPSGSEDVKK